MMYRINDGFNLERKDKTYFDKFNIAELLSVSKNMSSNSNKKKPLRLANKPLHSFFLFKQT